MEVKYGESMDTEKALYMEYIRKYLKSRKHTIEDLHTKMCSNALGVHKSVMVVQAEIGRYPLTCNIVKSI